MFPYVQPHRYEDSFQLKEKTLFASRVLFLAEGCTYGHIMYRCPGQQFFGVPFAMRGAIGNRKRHDKKLLQKGGQSVGSGI
jgi:hypothetical protein